MDTVTILSLIAIAATLIAISAVVRASRWKESWELACMDVKDLTGAHRRVLEELSLLRAAEARRQAQRVAAAKRAAIANHNRAEARKRKAEAKTAEALGVTTLRPRDQVVAGVIPARKAKRKSGAGTAAA